MINLTFHHGMSLIFNADDWYELRTKHRIVAENFGVCRTTYALPACVCPEAAYTLVKNRIVNLAKWDKLEKEPTAEDQAKFDEKTKKLYEEQLLVHREERQKQVEAIIDKIIEGKRKKGIEVSREEIIEEELSKIPEITEDNMLVQLFTEHPSYLKGPCRELPISILEEYTTSIKCAVFEDLWMKGYFITTGRKFGGDFLVYLGDPVAFHAVYIVKCVDRDETQNAAEVVALGRLGNSVKKKYILASLTPNGEVSYLTLTWEDL